MRTRPFLKWAGNKYRVLDRILATLPTGERLVEPFVGSAAVFLNTDYGRYLLADNNADLVGLYQALAREGTAFVEHCRGYFRDDHNRPETYYRLRDRFNTCDDPDERAALFVYLNRHGYNGLCRYNAGGGFNVPFGRYKRPYFPEREMLAFHARVRETDTVIRQRDFATVLSRTRPGDVVYADPPYVPLSASANFTSYSPAQFSLEQQQRLAEAARRAAARGVPVLISNHDTEFTQHHYHGATLSSFDVPRFISRDGSNRRAVGEVLALFE